MEQLISLRGKHPAAPALTELDTDTRELITRMMLKYPTRPQRRTCLLTNLKYNAKAAKNTITRTKAETSTRKDHLYAKSKQSLPIYNTYVRSTNAINSSKTNEQRAKHLTYHCHGKRTKGAKQTPKDRKKTPEPNGKPGST